jgi:hypothetical protein
MTARAAGDPNSKVVRASMVALAGGPCRRGGAKTVIGQIRQQPRACVTNHATAVSRHFQASTTPITIHHWSALLV